mmetsp:Transcript_35370/g.59611  ORF Transcript_35370/g.59611 Transcript_35370/m.59611 type:complete len:292 (+) Transcript_35370:1116-1991(+)
MRCLGAVILPAGQRGSNGPPDHLVEDDDGDHMDDGGREAQQRGAGLRVKDTAGRRELSEHGPEEHPALDVALQVEASDHDVEGDGAHDDGGRGTNNVLDPAPPVGVEGLHGARHLAAPHHPFELRTHLLRGLLEEGAPLEGPLVALALPADGEERRPDHHAEREDGQVGVVVHRETKVDHPQVEAKSSDRWEDEPHGEVVQPREVKRHLFAVVVADTLHRVMGVPEKPMENVTLGGAMQGREELKEAQLAESEKQRCGSLMVRVTMGTRFVCFSLSNQLTTGLIHQNLIER